MRLYCKSYLIMQIECAFPDMFLEIIRLKKNLKSRIEQIRDTTGMFVQML